MPTEEDEINLKPQKIRPHSAGTRSSLAKMQVKRETIAVTQMTASVKHRPGSSITNATTTFSNKQQLRNSELQYKPGSASH